jgi:hypothetical protein
MTYSAWLYHKQHGARVFEGSEEVDRALADGWVDTPAKLEEVAEANDGAPLLEVPAEIAGLDKDALAAMAQERYGLSLDKRFSLEKLQQQVAAKMAGVA